MIERIILLVWALAAGIDSHHRRLPNWLIGLALGFAASVLDMLPMLAWKG